VKDLGTQPKKRRKRKGNKKFLKQWILKNMGYPHYRCTTGEIPQKPSLGGGRGMQAKVP
jgi:hypothetical protein